MPRSSTGKDTAPPSSTRSGLQIVKNDKFYSRLISRETSAANNSCRVYYGVAAGAVPFMWESQPGTPKHPISSTAVPPLTPPPSYLFKPKKVSTKRHHSKSSLFMTMMPKLGFSKKTQLSPFGTTTSSSSSSSSSWSVSSSPPPSSSSRSLSYRGRNRFSSPRSSFSSRGGDEDQDQLDHDQSPTSTLCFGVVTGRQSSGASLRGCYSMVIMKSALSSLIRSHGSAHGAA